MVCWKGKVYSCYVMPWCGMVGVNFLMKPPGLLGVALRAHKLLQAQDTRSTQLTTRACRVGHSLTLSL